mgnify:CR=1 FL=1
MSQQFINLKERLAVFLMIVFFGLSIFSFSTWIGDLIQFSTNKISLGDPSHIFYTEFFTLLTFVDVLLLLSSARHMKNTILVIRNSGYVLATFLTRISFSLATLIDLFAILKSVNITCGEYLFTGSFFVSK